VESEHVVAVVDLLLTIGYIDGTLHAQEQAFIRRYMDQLIEHFAPQPKEAELLRDQVEDAYARLDCEIKELADEVVASGDVKFTSSRLKARAVGLFHAFSPADQKIALTLLDAAVHADGTVTPQEKELHDELRGYFAADATLVAPPTQPAPADLLQIAPPSRLAVESYSHPWLDMCERPFTSETFHADYDLIFQTISQWEKKRSIGNDRLIGVTDIGQLAAGTRMLDGHVHVMVPAAPCELIVLGDLHGCYACLKAALMQSRFIERAQQHAADPSLPDVKLVLLGDYLDRGRYGFEGVLRTALQLFVSLPDHVVLLRGNHEFLVRAQGTVVSAVNPAEAVPGIAAIAPLELLEAYRHLFDHMPTSFIFERTLFVHGGIPRDDTFAERYHDLGNLGDPVIRFEMMWGDPLPVDRVVGSIQRESPRFGFGREQFRVFMDRVGVHTMIRGHEAIEPGFITNYDLGHCRMHTLFSAGGSENADLPTDSKYRRVTPMALTIANHVATPWPIDYRVFNDPAHNGHYRR